MLQAFSHSIVDLPLFCRSCQGVFPHTIKSRIVLRPGAPAEPKEPLLVICHRCNLPQIFVADEFSAFSPVPATGMLFKIPGRSRLVVKDYVYIPGQPVTGVVKSRFRTGDQEIFTVVQSTGEELRIQSPRQIPNDAPPEGFRLLPYAVGDARIGDEIYHTGRDKFGKAIGLIFGRESKLVVQLDDDTLLLLALPPAKQIPDNRELTQVAHELLLTLSPKAVNGIHLEAGLGILYARGTCSTLPYATALRKTLQQVPNSRGAVDIIAIDPTNHVPDELLIQGLYDILLRNEHPIFGIEVICEQGLATVTGYCRNVSSELELSMELEALPGLRGLHLLLQLRPQDAPGDRERALTVGQALRHNATLRDTIIRIYSFDGVIHLEGIVHSTLQRNAAALAAMWAGRNFKIANHLRVEKKHVSPSIYIKVS